MNYRELGRTGWKVSEVSFGAWAIGGFWGEVDDSESMAALHRAVDLGVNFFDTADVYGDGHSERLLARLCKERSETIYIASKAGRRIPEHTPESYSAENLRISVEESLKRLETDAIDLLQLHCPHTVCYYNSEVFESLDGLVKAGKLRHYGVSVKNPEEAIKATDFPGVQSVQIIFNMFRHRPSELFFDVAKRRKVGILARVPLASGMLTGRMKPSTTFPEDDHRKFNREGARFDVGETFSGVPFETGLEAVEQLRGYVPKGATMTQFALRWILMFSAVTCAIPGGKRPAQVEENAAASDLEPLTSAQMDGVREVYNSLIRPHVHYRW